MTVPDIPSEMLPSHSTTESVYFREWLQYIAANYPETLSNKPIIAPVHPNFQGMAIGSSYRDLIDGLPSYSSFLYINPTSMYKYGTNNGSFYCSQI